MMQGDSHSGRDRTKTRVTYSSIIAQFLIKGRQGYTTSHIR